MEHQALSDDSRATLLRMTRVMFPHDGLPDEAYEKVVGALDAAARADADALRTLEDGGGLDGFTDSAPEEQLERLRSLEGSELFGLVHSTAVVELYDNPLVWRAFGYEGPSVHLGGYVNRGFDDLDWLPDPPLSIDPADAPSAATPETTAKFNQG